uniref:Cyclin N-terminal domain-containing protein n=1 Tax=Neobodo designis TaxID=312471 RepID=A0A7S1M9G0_NEODS|mmetsp:Transcript_3660/g.11520  ORF Transcript_3660/g.11520 Transcript_3660/m.11520 type:complete len:253 (+) Transcript_3660:132-890(+)|eukprot:CAMPEP_0174855928 /NCGR_PEP_ID=MMETSP1114-20130205/34602_1 /TAXON_ID=312471 /ORGANISM="Neobodo designis, Strain CCAP 1951/1" /LENGTH=252 /DNA_ID=CAMNT_0016090701 /DNA_START=126 /DNA_END=884 /DNA_ORIENTATION=+
MLSKPCTPQHPWSDPIPCPPRVSPVVVDLRFAANFVETTCLRGAALIASGDAAPPASYPAVTDAASIPGLREPITYFHSLALPPLSLEAMVAFLLRRVEHLQPVTCLAALVLMRRHAARTQYPTTQYMMHRLLLACVVVAQKLLQDSFPRNARIAACMGMSATEVNRLEATLLRDLDFAAMTTASDIRDLMGAAADWDRNRCCSATATWTKTGTINDSTSTVPPAPASSQGDSDFGDASTTASRDDSAEGSH